MAKRVQDMKPPRSDDVLHWLKKNVAEQKERYREIAKEMNDFPGIVIQLDFPIIRLA